MAGEIATAYVRLRPNTTGFQAEAAGEMGIIGRNLGKIFSIAFAAGFAVEGVKAVVEAATEHQAAFAVLARTIEDAGAANTVYGQSIESLLEKEARLKGFSDEDLASAFQRLVSVTHDSGKAFDDLQKAEDLARFRHIDLATAATALSKALQGSATSLTRYGIIVPKVTADEDALKLAHDRLVASGAKFTETEKEQYAALLDTAKAQDKAATSAAALALVTQRTGGVAATFADTAAGQFARLSQDIHQLEVAVGTQLLPPLATAAEAVGKYAEMLTHSSAVQADVSGGLHEIGSGLRTVKDVAETVGPPLLAVAGAAEKVASTVGAPAILAAVAAYKAVGVATGIAAAAETFYARALLANQGITLTATAENTALAGSYTEVGLASALATSERGVGAFAGGLGALAAGAASPAVIAIGVAALAGGITYLLTREDAWTAANKRLTGSLNDLVTAQDAQKTAQGPFAEAAAAANAAAANTKFVDSLDKLAQEATNKTLPTIEVFGRGITNVSILQERAALLTGKNAAAVRNFVDALDQEILATQKQAPGDAKRLEQIAKLAEALGRVPTAKEINISLLVNGQDPISAIATLGALGNAIATGIGNAGAAIGSAQRKQKAALDGLISSGKDTLASLQSTFSDSEQSLANAITGGASAVQQALVSAKENLASIGSALTTELGAFLDANPALTRLENLIAGRSNQEQKQGLQSTLKADIAALAAARAGISLAGPETSAQRKAINAFLAPDVEKVKADQRAIGDFILQNTAANLQKGIALSKAAYEREVQDQIAAFNLGPQTPEAAKKLTAQITGELKKGGVTFASIRKEQGLAAAEAFFGSLTGLGEQAGALTAGPTSRGSGLIPSITRPLDALKTANQQIASAQKSRDAAALAVSKQQTKLLKEIAGQRKITVLLTPVTGNAKGN